MKKIVAICLFFLSIPSVASVGPFEHFTPPDIIAETEVDAPYAVSYTEWAQKYGIPVDLSQISVDN